MLRAVYLPGMEKAEPNIHVSIIGGGTGSFTILQELKNHTANISALVNMSDDGGSTGQLRDELGVLPPGDVRQCLVALSNVPEVRDLFDYRFGEGFMKGHSLGNLILTGLELQYDDFERAVGLASRLLQITGEVIPVTLQKHDLVMDDADEVIRGEYTIGHRRITSRDATVRLDPEVSLHPRAYQAIVEADLLVVAPGNLYGSLLPALSPVGIRQAFAESTAVKIAVANLVTKPGQTDGWHVADYVATLEGYVGEDQFDAVLYNNEPPAPELLERYAEDGEFPVSHDSTGFERVRARAIGDNLIANEPFPKKHNDTLIPRTLIRHNPAAVCRALMDLYVELKQGFDDDAPVTV